MGGFVNIQLFIMFTKYKKNSLELCRFIPSEDLAHRFQLQAEITELECVMQDLPV